MFDNLNTKPPVQDSGLTIELIKISDLPATGSPADSRVQDLTDPPDGANRLYATDDRGVIWIIEDGSVLPDPFLDLRGRDDFDAGGRENGLRGLAFHPDFQTPDTDGFGKIYTTYTAPVAFPPGVTVFEADPDLPDAVLHNVVAEWTLVDPFNPVEVDPTSQRELFRVENPFTNHIINEVAFNTAAQPGDDDYGKLYIGLGDGGSSFDPANMALNLSFIHGSVLRIDPVEQTDGSAYGVPTDNPFTSVDDAVPEIWAFGLRNTQALSFDSQGRLFASEIGQGSFEEINLIIRGANYGWDDREGPLVLVDDRPVRIADGEADIDGLQFPFTGYDREEIRRTDEFGASGAAIGDGILYEGDLIPALRDHVVFSDFARGRVFIAPIDTLGTSLSDGQLTPNEFVQPTRVNFEVAGEPVTIQGLLGTPQGRADTRLGVDENGEIYIFSKQTEDLWKFVANADPVPEFNLVFSDTGTRAEPDPLGGAEITSGSLLYAFIEGNEPLIESVDFAFNGSPVGTDSVGPFDLNGTAANGAAIGFPTENLAPGVYSVTAEITFDDSGDSRTATVTETFSIVPRSDDDAPPPVGSQVIAEFGNIAVNQIETVVTLDNSFINPVVIALTPSLIGGQEVSVRFTEVTGNSFTVRLDEPSNRDDIHVLEAVSYLVVEEGSWQLADGTKLQAGTLTTDTTPLQGFESVAFENSFDAAPVVLTQLQTFNGDDFSNARKQEVTNNGFLVAIEEEEAQNVFGFHVNEEIGWVAIEEGSGTWSGSRYLADIQERSANSADSFLDFGSAFTDAPEVYVQTRTYRGEDPVSTRYTTVTDEGVTVLLQEDQTLDAERDHTLEDMDVFALQGPPGDLLGTLWA